MTPLQRLQLIFRECFEAPGLCITEATSPATLPDWDSVAQIHLVLAVEEAFNMRFTTDEVAGIHSVADLLRCLAARQ